VNIDYHVEYDGAEDCAEGEYCVLDPDDSVLYGRCAAEPGEAGPCCIENGCDPFVRDCTVCNDDGDCPPSWTCQIDENTGVQPDGSCVPE